MHTLGKHRSVHLFFLIYLLTNLLDIPSSYPDQRVTKDAKDLDMGVIGSVSMLQNASLSTQPITSFDWSPDKVSWHTCNGKVNI